MKTFSFGVYIVNKSMPFSKKTGYVDLLLFRPWWDALEDFVIYGLILLGLIVRKPIIFLKYI